MNHRNKGTNFDEVPRGLKCLCGGSMVPTAVEPGEEGYELHRFECEQCHAGTSVSFKRVER
jgi:hypothetical protein